MTAAMRSWLGPFGPGRRWESCKWNVNSSLRGDNSFHGEPLECVGGVLNDLVANARGGVYFSVTGATGSGVFYADPKGIVSQYGKDVPLANGIILSPDENTLYVTNGAVVFEFDVKPDGSLTNQREFGKLQGGEGGDGSAVDQQGAFML